MYSCLLIAVIPGGSNASLSEGWRGRTDAGVDGLRWGGQGRSGVEVRLQDVTAARMPSVSALYPLFCVYGIESYVVPLTSCVIRVPLLHSESLVLPIFRKIKFTLRGQAKHSARGY